MNELGPDARDLIRAVGDADGPTRADRERLRRALIATVGAAASTATTSTLAAQGGGGLLGAAVAGSAVAKVGVAHFLLSMGLGAMVGAAVVTSTTLRSREFPSTAAAPRLVAAPKSSISSSPSSPAHSAEPSFERGAPPSREVRQPEPLPGAPSVSRANPPPREPVHPPPADLPAPSMPPVAEPPAPEPAGAGAGSRQEGSRFAEEMQLLAEAQRARAQGRPDLALQKLSDYERRFPTGVMRSESLAAEVMCLCEVGRPVDAQARAELLIQSDPTSPLVPRILRSCVHPPR
jgi:hypothetical protein